MAELRATIVGEFKGKKAFKDADKATSALDKGVKRLGASLAATFGAQQLLKFAKNAAKAFIEDEQAATRLAQSVKNLGLAFETPRIEQFISQLSQASGVTDDQLRPSMQRLLQTTGSVTKSTELLTQALDISRGSGVDFETVVSDLSMAFVGQTRGLRKYSLGLSQAELKTMSFADVQAKLTKQFSGANAAYLETYAGKMQILSTAAGEAQETIGKGLVDALTILSGEGNTIQPLADSMQDFADQTANVIVGLADVARELKNLGGLGSLKFGTKGATISDLLTPSLNMIPLVGPLLEAARKRGQELNVRGMGGYPSSALGPGYVDPNDAARKKAEADAAKRAKQLADLQKKTLDTQKKQNALTKASKTLNLEAIGIEAALKGKISETDRLSLQLQKAILEGNATLATQLSDQLEAAIKRNAQLQAALLATPKAPNPYEDWKIPADLLNYTAVSLGVSPETVINAPQTIPTQTTDATRELLDAVLAAQAAQDKADAADRAAEAAAVYVKITLPDGTDMTSQAKTELTNQSLSGSFVNVNRLGRFANTPVAL
jgi:hypothetical protein